jgi:Tol biopolymer transport system component
VISADGRYVAFSTGSSDATVGDRSGQADIYVRDRVNNTTARVSVSSDGDSGNGESATPSISADGTRVAFYSPADNLAPGDTNGWGDVFLRTRAATCMPP